MKENETISTAKQEYEKSTKSEPLLDDAFYFALKRWEDEAIKREMRETGLAEGRAEGRTEGKQEGERQKQIEIAKKMKEKKIPEEQIMEITGLTKEELNNIENL